MTGSAESCQIRVQAKTGIASNSAMHLSRSMPNGLVQLSRCAGAASFSSVMSVLMFSTFALVELEAS
jgi:hypothetical protein